MAKKRRVALFLKFHDHYERYYFEGIERFASRHGPWEYDMPRDALGHPVQDLRHWDGDGVIGFLRTREVWEQIQDAGLPTVNISHLDPGPGIPTVRRDYAATGVLAAEHFLHRGFEHYAYFSSVGPDVQMRRILGQAFADRLSKEGYRCSVLYQQLSSKHRDISARNHEELLAWVKSLPKPVGILASDDLRGAALLGACRDLGATVPEEVSVIGRGNDELLCTFARPTLSSIHDDRSQIGYEAAALLHRLMEGGQKPNKPIFVAPNSVVARESTNVTVTGDVHIRKALRYIAEHACDPITVTDVVRQLPIRRTRFEFLFRRALHRPPYTEITRIRMDRAKELLAKAAHSVAEVAAKCGFANYSSFSVAFKRHVGQSPRAYRRQAQRNNIQRGLQTDL